MNITQRKNLPFELTVQIKRIIESMISKQEDYPSADVFYIKQYDKRDEHFTEDINESTERNLTVFWDYLKSIGAVSQTEFAEFQEKDYVLAPGMSITKVQGENGMPAKQSKSEKIQPVITQFYDGQPDDPETALTSSTISLIMKYNEEIIVHNPDIEKLKTLLEIAPPDISQSVESKSKDRFYFYGQTGDIEYLGNRAITKVGRKDYALLKLLSENKNTSFNIEDIKKHINHLVENLAHRFKQEKDVDDTIRQIKSKIKLKNGSYFPIVKRGGKGQKIWLWLEK